MSLKTSNFLEGYQLEDDWCSEIGVSPRASQRYRLCEIPGLPYVELGGKIYIKIDEGRQWLANRTRRRNTAAA
jgi:hypothetical protein